MQAIQLLHNILVRECPKMHAKRREALMAGVRALVRGGKLWLTALGRHVGGPVAEKHSIKRMDRLLGNRHLSAERGKVYGWLVRALAGSSPNPVILVDWSGLNKDGSLHVLRASVAVGGRALVLYEEVHEKEGKATVHRAFLKRLSELLGSECKPVLVTDAGFKRPWFEDVAKLGWYYVGRVRGHTKVREAQCPSWVGCKSLYARARRVPQALGAWLLTESAPWPTQLYLYRGRSKGRVARTAHGHRARSHKSLKNAAREREPWLLASNLTGGRGLAKRVVRLYRLRMQIELGFRDLKTPRNGLSFREQRSTSRDRVANLLLLAALGVYVLWLKGLAAER
ncbi:MAG: IS4 family transposase, partial [Planctomycetota bacterium]